MLLIGRFRVPTLRKAFARYLYEVSPQKKQGLKSDPPLARVWLRTMLADRRMCDIKPKHIVVLRDKWLKEVAPATVVRRLAALSHLYTVAMKEWGHYNKIINPVLMIAKPKVRNSRNRRVINDLKIPDRPHNEVDWILSLSRSKQLKNIVILALETAMRRSEVSLIQWEFVNFENRTVYLPDTKNGYPRTVPLSPMAIDVLHSIDRGTNEGRVFDITPGAVSRAFQRALYRAR